MVPHNWKLSPSDFAFLWEECKRCFYLKVTRQFYRPKRLMPKVFTLIDSEMKKFYSGKRTDQIAKDIPSGVIAYGEKWVESQIIKFPNCPSSCYIFGKFDTIIQLDDGAFAVVDFKTAQRRSEHIPLYSRQLHAYAYALENPTPSSFKASPISRLGLLVFEPEKYAQSQTGYVGYAGHLSWIEVPRNEKGFLDFLEDVLSILASAEAPAPTSECEWCRYREEAKMKGF